MNLSVHQMNILWESPKENCDKLYNQFKQLPQGCELVILPEMFNTGFSMDSEKIAEEVDGETTAFLKRCANEFDIAIMGSIAVKEDGNYYNRLLFVTKERVIHYDKKHLFRISGENLHYSQGEERVIIDYKGVKILPQICYDLRFPVWSRNCNNEYDLIVYVASWPQSRIEVWKTLLKARAIENQCYVIGVNRIGNDNIATYNGNSAVIDFYGNIVADCPNDQQGEIFYSLDTNALKEFREKFPVYLDADQFIIKS